MVAEMRIIGCDLRAQKQTVTMLDTPTGEVVKLTRLHENNNVRELYSNPTRRGPDIEPTGSMQWFQWILNMMGEHGIECQVGYPARTQAAEARKQKLDRPKADLILK
jgi:hypothetical protein